ncbi:glycosyltransferase family 31 protein [Hypoxylon rubiginosum]|uniref:Glycosyltransferase family 31 protein n=1 Tax=Hypoxylon rubiginosum TaxID=110542 RepID=A0ACB9ZCJ6_9PEZI|nr:glycosyltransferase family 31 protein [Hypoxylon rubiginosum]
MIICRPFHGGYVGIFQLTIVLVGTCMLLAVVRHSDHYLIRSQPPSIYEYTDGKTRGARQNETTITPPPPSDETTYLRYLTREYGLSNEIPWFARRIQPRFDSRGRKSMTEISKVPFMPRGFERIRTDDKQLDLRAESPPVRLSVTQSAKPDAVNASALLFGISTSYDRLTYGNASLMADWARWLTDGEGKSNGASLVLTLHRASGAEIETIGNKLREAGIDAVVLPANSTHDSAARYLDLAGLLARRKDELLGEGHPIKFLALVDDDVFFPSLGKLLARLDRFDARKKAYVGLPSERADWTVENNVTLTYGGGAVLLTPPMADAVSRLPCVNETARGVSSAEGTGTGTGTGQWDERLYSCIAEHTDEKLHILPSLYTPGDDLYGLPRTGYEGGVQPLALHHYRHRRRFDPSRAHLVASLCGEDCFLQRFFFRGDAWILVNGYSVSQYPDGVDVLPAAKSMTLQKQDGSATTTTTTGNAKNGGMAGRVSDRLSFDKQDDDAQKRVNARRVVSWAGAKRTWRLLDSRRGAGGEVWQAYVKRRGSSSSSVPYGDEDDWVPEDTVHTQDGPSDVDSVIVLIWEP